MVKGVSRQVIVVQSPQTQMFEQAIFILKDDCPSVSDAELLKEAKRLINSSCNDNRTPKAHGFVWACAGAMITGAVWLLTILFSLAC